MLRYTCALIAFASVVEAARYKSGAVTGYEKFTYGKFITRMKAPNKKGTVSSFFTYWNGPDFYPGGWNELDVEIVPSVSQNPFSMNIIYGDGQAKHETHQYKQKFDPKDEWHIYEMAWTPEFVSWSIDNTEVRRVKSDDPSLKFLNKGQSVMMNFWTPTFESWGKGFNAADMPWYVMYDYVETFTYNSETNGFDFHWRDDFVTFDAERWHKSDNTTFDANSTTFRASQSYIDSGHLVLKMEPDTHQGLHPGQHYRPTKVEPEKTEPAYEHKGAKGEKTKKEDEHYDVLQQQHFSHVEHEHHPHFAEAERPHEYGYRSPFEARGGYEHERTPREMAAYDYYGQHVPMEYPTHYPVAEEFHHDTHQLGAEDAGAHLDAHQAYPHHSTEMGPHDAQPIHSASTEPHVASAEHQFYGTPMYHHNTHAVADNLSFHAAGVAYGDESVYHHEDRHYVPEHRVEGHHVDGHHVDYEHIQALPTYEELLYSYLHHGEHESIEDMHHDGEHVTKYHEYGQHGGRDHDIDYTHQREGDRYLHRRDVDIEELHDYPEHDYQHYDRVHEQAHDQKLNPEHYRHDIYQEGDHQTVHDERRFDDHRHEAEHHEHGEHHEGAAYWRGDHYDDHHKTDEDFRHDTTEHAYHAGDTYGHDTDYHQGTQLMHDIEHEYDELFHTIESETKHGVEHHDVEHHMLAFDGQEGDEERAHLHHYKQYATTEADAHHGEVEGPSMYAWAAHEQHEIRPQPHHETFAEMYYREHHMPSYHQADTHHDEQEMHFEPLGAHHETTHSTPHTVAHREAMIPAHHEAVAPHHTEAHQTKPKAAPQPAPKHEATKHEAAPHHEAPHHEAPAAKKTAPAAAPAPAKKPVTQPAVGKKLEYVERHHDEYEIDRYL